MDKRTKIGKFIHNSWTNMNLRCGKYRHLQTKNKNHCYENISIEFTQKEYKDFCLLNKEKIMFLIKPSVDRIDSSKNYSLTNIQFIELKENIRKKKVGNLYITNSFGVKRGVRRLKTGTFNSRISFNNKEINIGTFKTEAQAYEAFRNKYFELYKKYPW